LVRHARLAADLAQAELAERAGTSQLAVARHEQGSVEPSMSTFERLLAGVCGRRAIVSTVPQATQHASKAATTDRTCSTSSMPNAIGVSHPWIIS
jgi:transcriptional regulator with XRE-family HTH domain